MRPRVITLYSFKGGVGRTLLGANLAVIFARVGRTLLWDLDLEAPSLHRIPDLRSDEEPEEGFVEWLARWQRDGSPASVGAEAFERLLGSVRPTRVSSGLHTLQAFGAAADVVARYDDVDWPALFGLETGRGIALFRTLIARFGEAGFDTILLDSRTGLTDIGGLLTAALPHVTVLVGGYSAQNTHGLALVWRALHRFAERQTDERGELPLLRRLLVASPIPQDDIDLIAAGQKVWRDAFGLLPGEHIVEIPFDQRLLFHERLLVTSNADAPVAARYFEVARRLSQLLDEAEEEFEGGRDDAQGRTSIGVRGDKGAHTQRGLRFEERVAYLLLLMGYAVQRGVMAADMSVDLLASKRIDFSVLSYVIECKETSSPIGGRDVALLNQKLSLVREEVRQAKGMVVSSAGFTAAAKRYADAEDLTLLTLSDLERDLFDFAPYLRHVRAEFEASALFSEYVPQRIALAGDTDNAVPLLEHAVDWARGTGPQLWMVAGTLGAGKSTFVRRLAYELAVRCETDSRLPVPLAVGLRNVATGATLSEVLQAHLSATIGWHGDPDIILHLFRVGRVVILLDGLDELGSPDGTTVDEWLFRFAGPRVAQPVTPEGNRILITTRKGFLSEIGDVENGSPGRIIDTLLPFTSSEVDSFLSQRIGPSGAKRLRRLIARSAKLRSLATRPLLLKMLADRESQLESRGRLSEVGLYRTYVDEWITRERPAGLSSAQKRELVETFASELWRSGSIEMHYRDLEAKVRSVSPLEPDEMNAELRRAAFLVSSSSGHYRFAHQSFHEFFLADRIRRACQANDESLAAVLDTHRLSQQVFDFLHDLADEAGIDDGVTRAIADVLARPRSPRAAVNALLYIHRISCRGQGIVFASLATAGLVRKHMENLVVGHADLRDADLINLNLSGVFLRGANLSRVILAETSLAGADLSKSLIDSVNADDADFSGADLRFATISRTRLSNADLRSADLTGTKISDSDLRGVKADGAILRGSL